MMEFCYACIIGVALGMTLMAVIFYCTDDRWKARAKELAEADKEGRVVILPCRPGETVYKILLDEVIEKRVGKFIVNSYTRPMIWAELDCDWCSSETVRWDLAIGKTVFLTREGAEKALEAMREAVKK